MRAILLLFALGCDDPQSGVVSAQYQGAGWSAQLNPDQTFRLLHTPPQGQPDQLINGNSTAANGLVSLTVTASAGTGQPPEGAVGQAALIPDTLLVLNPFAGGNLVPMVPAGTCPAEALHLDLVAVTSEASAAFSYDPSSGAALLGSLSLGGGPCAAGIVATDGGAQLFLSEGGAAIVQQQGEIYLGLPSAGVALSSLAGSYAGFLLLGGANQVVQASLSGDDSSVSVGASTLVLSSPTSGSLDGQPLSCISAQGLLACTGAGLSLVLVSS